MSVHIGELHTDVVPSGTPAEGGRSAGPGPEQAEERAREARRREEWLAGRTAAEGYED